MARKFHINGMVVVLCILFSAGVFAQEEEKQSIDPDYDKHFNFLIKESYQQAEDSLKGNGFLIPYGAALMPKKSVKKLNLGGEKLYPTAFSLGLLRDSLKAWADKKLILASVVYYAAEVDGKDGKQHSVLIMELEDATGRAIRRIMPYQMKEGAFIAGTLHDEPGQSYVFINETSSDAASSEAQ